MKSPDITGDLSVTVFTVRSGAVGTERIELYHKLCGLSIEKNAI